MKGLKRKKRQAAEMVMGFGEHCADMKGQANQKLKDGKRGVCRNTKGQRKGK